MIQRVIPEADGSHLHAFCESLESILDEGVKIVPSFIAINKTSDLILAAFGWPTEEEWNLALEMTFGVRVLKRKTQ